MENRSPEELKSDLDAGKTVFLKLWKPGCGACKLSEPALSRIEPRYSDQMSFVQINTAEHPEILDITDTEVLPVFYVFKEKARKGEFIGFKGIKKLEEFIQDSLSGS